MAKTDTTPADPNARITRPGGPPPHVGGGIPEAVDEDMTAPAARRAPPAVEVEGDEAVIARAGQLAREAQTRGEDGQKVFEAALVAAGVTLPTPDAPRCPPGYAMFRNTDPINVVKVTLMDGNNRPRTAKVKPNGFEVIPIEYAHLMAARAPQLVEVGRTPADAE